ncbi:MAG: type III secretion system chaperone [Puniceicoccales bacterium]|nr:type III secretion system chaperone [Puniceicoccales bacterium]
MPIDTFTNILHEFASRINLSGLQIDSSGYCCLDVDQGTLIHLKHENKRDSMIFIAEIGQIPETNAGSVLRYLLRINNDPEESKGMTLSYNAESNNAAIGYQFPLRFMTIDKFEEFFRVFLDEVDRWKQKMVLYTQGTLPKGEEASGGDNAGETSSSASSTPQGKEPEFMIGA